KEWRTATATLQWLGREARFRSEFGRATACFEEALALARQGGNTYQIARALTHLGLIASDRGDHERAARLIGEALVLNRELKEKKGIGLALAILGNVARARKEPDRAARLFGAAEALYEAVGVPISPGDGARQEIDLAAVRADLEATGHAVDW